MTIKNIIFDLGGVILNIDLRKTQDAFTALGVKQIEEVFRMGHIDSFFKVYERGGIDDQQFIASVQKLAGIDSGEDSVVEAWNALLLDFPPERIALLRRLRTRYRLFLLSNTSALHHVAFQEMYSRQFGGSFDELFERTYYSHLTGHHKPEAIAYQQIVDENGLVANETLFIDDSPANVEGANLAGLRGLHLVPGKTILDLGLETIGTAPNSV